MIGTQADAQAIFAHVRTCFDGEEHLSTLPGWIFIGAGAYRSVWLNLATNVVYKVAHSADPFANDDEYYNYQKWSGKLPEGLRFPEMTDFYIVVDYCETDSLVICAEFIHGDVGSMAEDAIEPFMDFIHNEMKLYDTAGSNIAMQDDTVILLDFAF